MPAIRNKWYDLTLVEADLSGGDPTNTAILNECPRAFLRDIKQTGYGHLLRDSKGELRDGAWLDEWLEGKAQSLFGSAPRSLRLPIKETPPIPWETNLPKWARVEWTHGGDDVSEALQGAIDRAAKEGQTTLYLPRHARSYEYPKLTRPIRVHGGIRRIIGMENILDIADPTGSMERGEQAVFTFEDLTSDAIVIERFFLLGGWNGPERAFLFENKSGKAIVFQNTGHSGIVKKPSTSGQWFIEDVSPGGTSTLFIGPGEKCWARQFNPESPQADMIDADGGQLWILGLKTEGRATHLVAKNHAQVELLGGVSYQSWAKQPLDPPTFKVTDSQASFTFGFYHYDLPFTTIVEEGFGGQTRQLYRTNLSNYHLPLYRGSATGK